MVRYVLSTHRSRSTKHTRRERRLAAVVLTVALTLGVGATATPATALTGNAAGPTRATAMWHALTPPVQPGPRAGASLAYDRHTRLLVLWGGGEPTGGLSAVVAGDTWGFDGTTWRQLASGPARIRSSLVFDPQIRSLLSFGGSSPTGVTGDTWTFDGSTWRQIAVSGPPAREGAAMAYDPKRREIILFGGDTDQAIALGDTWAWTRARGWVQLSPPVAPTARFGSSLVFDRRLGKLVLFGGESTSGAQNDTWTFDGATWERLTTLTSPAPRVQQAMTYDKHLQAVVLWGGVGAHADFADTWSFTGSAWTQLATTGPGADQGQEAALAYDPTIRAAILVGGAGAQSGISGAEWTLR